MSVLRRWGGYLLLLVLALIAGLAAGPDAAGSSTLPLIAHQGPQGVAVLETWLRERGRTASPITEPWNALPAGVSTLVLAEPAARPYSRAEVEVLRAFVQSGSTLVFLAPRALDAQPHLRDWLGYEKGDKQPLDRENAADVAGATTTVQLRGGPTLNTRTLRVSAARGWRCATPDLVPVDAHSALCFHPEGAGQVWLGAGADLAENRRLDLADNLKFWAGLPAPIAFDESHHVAVLPPSLSTNLWATWLQCGVVALAFLLGRMRRLGVARPTPKNVNRSSLEYVHTFGALTAQAGVEPELVDALRAGLRRRLHERLGLGPTLPIAVIAQELEQLQRCPASEFVALDRRLEHGARQAGPSEYLALSREVAALEAKL